MTYPLAVENKKGLFIGAGACAVVLIAVLAIRQIPSSKKALPVAPAPALVAPPPKPSGPPLPKLEDSDPWVRSKAQALSADARFAAVLKAEDLLPRFVSALGLIAAGKVPSEALGFLAPKGRFAVKSKGGRLLLNARSFARYDAAASLIASVDAKAAAGLFIALKPLLQQAYGAQGAEVTDLFAHAAGHLLAAPVAKADIVLMPSEKGIVYVFADESLERLSPAQKVMVRMGPKNETQVQAKIRELARALGIADARLTP